MYVRGKEGIQENHTWTGNGHWPYATLFRLLIAFYIYFYMIYPGSLLIFFIACRSVGGLHWGAEPRHELGTALQLSSALAAELRHTLIELRRTHARGHVLRFDSTSPPTSLVNFNSPNQASTCFSERRKTKREVRYCMWIFWLC